MSDKLDKQVINFGHYLINTGTKIIRGRAKIDTVTFNKSVLKDLLTSQLGINENDIYCADSSYELTNWETWKRIIKLDKSNIYKWTKDVMDCNNQADYFGAIVALIYHLNSCAKATGELLDPENDEHIGWHRYNIIPAHRPGHGLDYYLYDPTREGKNDDPGDYITEIKMGEMPILGNWKYRTTHLDVN